MDHYVHFSTVSAGSRLYYIGRADKGNTGDDEIFEEEDPYTAVSNFKAGWNLGNTLDSTSYDISKIGTDEEEGWILKYGKKDSNGNYLPSNWETAWGQPETNQEIADFIINNGFNSIRIPVTWAEHLDKDNKVDYVWFDTGLEYQATKDHLKYLENKYGIEIKVHRAIKPIPTTCRTLGQPFVSKNTAEMIDRLQRHNFQ